jgi:esterase/lipase
MGKPAAHYHKFVPALADEVHIVGATLGGRLAGLLRNRTTGAAAGAGAAAQMTR